MPKLLLATNNPHKVQEISALLQLDGWTLVTPSQAGIRLDPDETAATYAGNAAIKALAFAQAAGVGALADDSGLEVAALDGRPGVRSARYGGPGAGSAEQMRRLLAELGGVPPDQRQARFCCAVVIATPDGRTWTAEGACEGRIAAAPRGDAGFGYDPIFLLPDEGRTMAELGSETKNRISHRAIAVRQAGQILAGLTADPAFR